ncbi:hypothetical protein NITHO_1350003 [Nitrolancea hollandica Lb]|uniref:Uncharacterized protein n=1 Tax=Nitrolancea hollandica Lb TaxID=1129897 RepID=I4ED34_9BACT|nr:hypothetical protein NITHO_1350003 [Nitrolancea hollandica Lb]
MGSRSGAVGQTTAAATNIAAMMIHWGTSVRKLRRMVNAPRCSTRERRPDRSPLSTMLTAFRTSFHPAYCLFVHRPLDGGRGRIGMRARVLQAALVRAVADSMYAGLAARGGKPMVGTFSRHRAAVNRPRSQSEAGSKPAARGSVRPLLVILSEREESSNEKILHFVKDDEAGVQDDEARMQGDRVAPCERRAHSLFSQVQLASFPERGRFTAARWRTKRIMVGSATVAGHNQSTSPAQYSDGHPADRDPWSQWILSATMESRMETLISPVREIHGIPLRGWQGLS